jgi:hypothetical protein
MRTDGGTEGRGDRRTDRQIDRHDEANSCSSQFCEGAWETTEEKILRPRGTRENHVTV